MFEIMDIKKTKHAVGFSRDFQLFQGHIIALGGIFRQRRLPLMGWAISFDYLKW